MGHGNYLNIGNKQLNGHNLKNTTTTNKNNHFKLPNTN